MKPPATANYTAYLDDSYQEGASIVTLAGYLAPTTEWVRFEDCAKGVFDDFSVQTLHSKDFRSGRKCFKDWPRDKKILFIEAIVSCLQGLEVCAISTSVTKGLSKSFKRASKKNSGSSPLGIAFGQVAYKCCEGSGLPLLKKERKVHFVIEAGNKNNAQIARDFKERKKKGGLKNARSLSFEPKTSCRAIQLADFWAFYSRRLATDILKHPEVNDPNRFIEPELAKAAAITPHAMDINYGTVSQQVRNKNLLNVGMTKRIWLSPLS